MINLASIKNCHRCDKREVCNLKRSPANLSLKARRFEHVNRSTKRNAVPFIAVESFCTNFGPEEANPENE
jgi:hypothetical protein